MLKPFDLQALSIFLCIKVALVTDRTDGYARFQKSFEEDLVGDAGIEIVDQQRRVRIAFACCFEHLTGQSDAAQLPAYTGHRIVVFIKIRHDNDLVDHVPHIHNAAESRNLAADTVKLASEDLIVVVIHQPGSADGMPAERMSLDANAVLLQPA